MQISRFLSPKTFFYTAAHFVLQTVNTACLVLIGYNTVRLWTDGVFDMKDTVAAFPAEPEFADKTALAYQIWGGTAFETMIFLFGSFLCYERLIRSKSLAKNLLAPLILAFVWACGNAVGPFLPAADKVSEIRTCQAVGITWNEKDHACNVMDLEKRRMDKFLAELKTKRKKDFRPVYAPFYNPAVTHKDEPEKEQIAAKPAEKKTEAPAPSVKNEKTDAAEKSDRILKKPERKKTKKALSGKVIRKPVENKTP